MVEIGREPATPGPSRGDIHFIDLPDRGGSVIRGPHPVAVLQADRLARSATVVVAPLTSSPRSAALDPPYLVPVSRRESGLDRDGWLKSDQLMTIPAAALGRRAGRLAPAALDRVAIALRFVLEL